MVRATALPALMLSAGLGALPMFLVAFPIAMLVTLPIGMLLYAAARATGLTGWISAGIGGLLTSAILWLPGLFDAPSFDEKWFDNVASVTGGQYTLVGWIERLTPAAGIAATGLISGLFFWYLLVRDTLSRRARWLNRLLVALAIAASILYPFAMQDRSCHGAASSPSVAQLGLRVPPDQWAALAHELDGFARQGDWSRRTFVAAGRAYPWLDYSLCKAEGTRISVLGAPGMEQIGEPVRISITRSGNDGDWMLAFRMLHDRLEARWPGAIEYQNAMGQDIPDPPGWLINPAPSSTAH